MKKIAKITLFFLIVIVISSPGYADSQWYTLANDPESAAIDGFHWRKKCARSGYNYSNPADQILSLKMYNETDSFTVNDVKEGGIVIQTTITEINKNNQKHNEVTIWYRGKKRCEKFSLKERMAIEKSIEMEKKKRRDKELEKQRIRDRYK